MTAQPFYKRIDWWLSMIGGVCIGYGISHYFTGSAVVASIVLALGLVLFASSFALIEMRYRS